MVDPPAPQDIARRSFDVVRRGYEQQSVRGFLHEVSALVDRLQRSEAELRERAERAEAKLGVAEQPDESMLLEVLGAETTRVLTSAHEAAAEIRSKAEASVERIVAEATAEAARLRSTATQESEALLNAAKTERAAILEQARGELDRRTEEALAAVAHLREEGEAQAQALRDEADAVLARARGEAEVQLDAAREQGRMMVAEAQAVREKVLRDLVVRRKRARQQVEKLNAGRERLLQAYDVVRRTIDEATTELNVSLTDARLAANAAARRVEDEPDASLEEIDAEVSTAGLLDLAAIELDDRDADLDDQDDQDDQDDDTPSPLSGEVPVVGAAPMPTPVPAAAAPTTEGPGEVVEAPAPVVDVGATAPGEPTTLGSLTALDDRRARKSKRRKGFEGLPSGELDVVTPPSPGEGVRIIPAPGEPTEAPEALEPTGAKEPVDLLQDPVRVPDAAIEAAREPVQEVPEATPAAPEAEAGDGAVEVDAEPDDEVVDIEVVEVAVEAVDVEVAAEVAVEIVDVEVAAEVAVEIVDVEVAAEVAVDIVDVEVAAEVEAVEVAVEDEPSAGDPGESSGDAAVEATASSADDVFARLRAESAPVPSAEGDVAPDDAVEEPDAEAARASTEAPVVAMTVEADETGVVANEDASGPFAARARAVGPLEKELGRALKRALADEQNEVLDLLRRSKPKSVDDVLPHPDQHAARWAEAAAEVLAGAAAAGAASLGGSPSSVADLATELAASLTVPLRERIDRGFAASDGNLDDIADRVRALYREWRGQRLSDAAGHYTSAAYARGVFDAIDEGAKVCWVIDPSAGACPDCDDNVLAGTVVRGEEFPTGNAAAPAHPGCHCLVLASPT